MIGKAFEMTEGTLADAEDVAREAERAAVARWLRAKAADVENGHKLAGHPLAALLDVADDIEAGVHL